ncbi:unnamed protein product, partial [Discosporangium mesarthrocarpum]
QLLDLSALCLRCEVGSLLPEESCWNIFETCYQISTQERASPLLRDTAGNTLAHIVLMLFSMSWTQASSAKAGGVGEGGGRGRGRGKADRSYTGSEGLASGMMRKEGAESAGGEGKPKGDEGGGGVLVKVMRFLSRLSDPRTHSEGERILSLSLVNIALEAGGVGLGRHRSLVQVMRGDLCKRLLQNSQTEDLNILSLTLRVVFNLFNSIKDHLKVQLEVFLTR